MSIQKLQDDSRVKQAVIPFSQICNRVIQNIKNADAFLVWAYLISKPSQWKVVKEHIKNHFGFGDKKIKTIFAYLNKHKLIEYHTVRTPDGRRFARNDIQVLPGIDFVINQEDTKDSLQGHFSTRLKTRTSREAGTIKKDIQINKNKKIKREPLSIFEPDEANAVLAKDLGIDLKQELLSFLERHKGKKTQYEFSRWLKQAKEYQSSKNSKHIKQVEPYSAVNKMDFYESPRKLEAIKQDLTPEPRKIEKLLPFKEQMKIYKAQQGCSDEKNNRNTTGNNSRRAISDKN